MFLKVREISVAVADIKRAADRFAKLGFNMGPIWTDPTPLIEASGSSATVGSTKIGFMSSTGEGTPISKFLKKRGEGLFSITLLVEKIEAVMAKWEFEGVRFVLDQPLELPNYAHLGPFVIPLVRVNWTRPSSLHGLVIELHEFRDGDGRLYDPDVPRKTATSAAGESRGL